MKVNLDEINKIMGRTLGGTLGINIIEITTGRVVATMPVDQRHHQPMGLLHGGASVALAETVASIGGWHLVADENKVVVGQEINANHLRSVQSGLLRAVGACLHAGRASQVWEIKIYNETDQMVCISRCTLAVVAPR
jgi:1,4-dihydroxy-2-naphthoyl-CoA hydrolase